MSRGVEALEENAGPRQLTRPVNRHAPLSAAHHRELKYNTYNCFAAAASPHHSEGCDVNAKQTLQQLINTLQREAEPNCNLHTIFTPRTPAP